MTIHGQRIGSRLALSLAVLALWLLSRPYRGITHDGRLYVGQALAALSPQTIGRDLMFVDDGQFAFTLFSRLTVPLVRLLGAEHASMLLASTGLVAFLAAFGFLAAKFAQGRLFWTMLLFVALVPSDYGGFGVFSFAEPYATPRPFACAAVLLAFGFGLTGRFLAAWMLLALAALLHPIMALPAVGVLTLVLAAEHWRRPHALQIIGAALVIVVVGICLAAWADLPVAGRLFTRVDPEWREALEFRSPYLFASLWPLRDWGLFVVQATTLVAAALVLEGRARALLVAIASVSLAGVAASVLIGDLMGSLLVVQVQLWRASWLACVAAAIALPLCWQRLWGAGATARAAIGLLLTAWVLSPISSAGATLALVALALIATGKRYERFGGILAAAAGFLLLAAAGGVTALYGVALVREMEHLPRIGDAAGVPLRLVALAAHIPLAGLALWSLGWRQIVLPRLAAPVIAVTAMASLFAWDQRSDWQVLVDRGSPAPGLAEAPDQGSAEILWLDELRLGTAIGIATWRLAGSPNWASTLQGASTVFSRPQAMLWKARLNRVLEHRLAVRGDEVEDWRTPLGIAPILDPGDVHEFCGAADAPRWIVVPADKAARLVDTDDDRVAGVWESPAASYTRSRDAERIWIETRRFARIRCAPLGPPGT